MNDVTPTPSAGFPVRPIAGSIIERIIGWSARNKLMVFMLVGALLVVGGWCMKNTPLDAIPDLSAIHF